MALGMHAHLAAVVMHTKNCTFTSTLMLVGFPRFHRSITETPTPAAILREDREDHDLKAVDGHAAADSAPKRGRSSGGGGGG